MKTYWTVIHEDGKMKAFSVPEEISLIGYSKALAIKMLEEYKQLVKSARAAALPIANESKEKVKELMWQSSTIFTGDMKLRDQVITQWQPDQTKEYRIEVEMREEANIKDPCPQCGASKREQYKGCNKIICYKGESNYNGKVLVLVEDSKIEQEEDYSHPLTIGQIIEQEENQEELWNEISETFEKFESEWVITELKSKFHLIRK